LRFLLLLSLILPLASAADATTLREDMAQALREEGLPGAVWSTVAADSSFVADSVGLKNIRAGEQMAPDSLVQVGSIGKVVLAMGVLRLVTEGRLSLDAPVSGLLPSLALDNPWAASDPMRVRHLLAHTSGLDNVRFWQVFSLKPRADAPLIDALSGAPSLLRLRTRPGSRYAYSNMGYTVLGMVIESVTGERYEHYLHTQVLRPLSMHDSTFDFVSQVGAHADARLAMGHFEAGAAQVAVPIYLRPAGQFTTTAKDMAMFARYLISDGESFVDRALLDQLGPPAGTEAALAGLAIGHGLALAQRDRHGVVGSCHPGESPGFHAMLCLYPEHRKAFFVAMNGDIEGADYDRFNALLIRELELAADVPEAMPPGTPDAGMEAWEGFYVPAPNGLASLLLIDTALNFVRVRWDGAWLHIKPFQSGERRLAPVGNQLFQASDRSQPSHVLLTAADGSRVLSDGLHSYEQAPLARMVLLWLSFAAGLAGLVWIFLSGTGRAMVGRMQRSSPLLAPWLAGIALFLPLPLFLRQSFLQLGDVTAASVLLAVVTGLLPLAMIAGLVAGFRRHAVGVIGALDMAAMLAVLQWTIVLAAWNLLPTRLWVL
jgi:CubicO group peptidase (beta-lactamase class C family)